jgi:hypothetical protein
MHLGDFWRVLRNRPSTTTLKTSNLDMEYIPNNPYSYYQVIKTLSQVAKAQVKPSRYWNELPAKDIPDDILYSLSEYWPSMPRDINIVNDNHSLGLKPYRMSKQSRAKVAPLPGARAQWVYDNSHTVEYLLATGEIPDDTQLSFGNLMVRVQELDMICTNHIANWPFLTAQRLLKLQLGRLRVIKQVLTARLHGHPLNSDNVKYRRV